MKSRWKRFAALVVLNFVLLTALNWLVGGLQTAPLSTRHLLGNLIVAISGGIFWLFVGPEPVEIYAVAGEKPAVTEHLQALGFYPHKTYGKGEIWRDDKNRRVTLQEQGQKLVIKTTPKLEAEFLRFVA